MVDFVYYAPTKVVFGRDAEKQIGALVAGQGCKKVLLHYGGESARRCGLLEQVQKTLEESGISYVALGGVVPNPKLSLVRQGIALCKKEGVGFILAVGGGSVIDSAKAIGYGAVTEVDVWDFYLTKEKPEGSLPVGAVVTIAAAGSEMSNSSVITNDETGEKRGMRNDICRCKFAVMNPERTFTLTPEQTAAGCADIVMHTLERFFAPQSPMGITDALAEGLLRTVMDKARLLTREPDNYEARASVMWAGALSHNDLTGVGAGGGDWACHQISHALGARYNMVHGEALTAVWGSWARYVYKDDPDRFAQLAETVLDLPHDPDTEALAFAGIEEMEGFFWALDMPTSFAEADIELSETDIDTLVDMISYGHTRTIGTFKVLKDKDIAAILKMARG